MFKDMGIKTIVKLAVMAFLILIGVMLLPSIVTTQIQNTYIKNHIIPFEDSDFDRYLNKTASYYQFYYQKTPLVDHEIIEQDNVYMDFSVYAISYYQEHVKADRMLFFIHDAQYKDETYASIDIKLTFKNSINTDSSNPIYTIEQSALTNHSVFPIFWAADVKNNVNDTKENQLSAITLTIHTKSKQVATLAFSDTSIPDAIITLGLTDYNLINDYYKLSDHVSNKETNIPTDQEIIDYDLYYQSFTEQALLSQGNWIMIVSYGLYSLVVLTIFYFLFIHKELLNSLKKKKLNQESKEDAHTN